MKVLERSADADSLACCQGPYGLSELSPTGTTAAEQQKSHRFFNFISSVSTAFNIFITCLISCYLIWPLDLTFANLPLETALLSLFWFAGCARASIPDHMLLSRVVHECSTKRAIKYNGVRAGKDVNSTLYGL